MTKLYRVHKDAAFPLHVRNVGRGKGMGQCKKGVQVTTSRYKAKSQNVKSEECTREESNKQQYSGSHWLPVYKRGWKEFESVNFCGRKRSSLWVADRSFLSYYHLIKDGYLPRWPEYF